MSCFQAFITVAGKIKIGHIGRRPRLRVIWIAQCLLGADHTYALSGLRCAYWAQITLTRYLRHAPIYALACRLLSLVHLAEPLQ